MLIALSREFTGASKERYRLFWISPYLYHLFVLYHHISSGMGSISGKIFPFLAVLITPMIDMYFSKKKAVQVLRSITILTAISIIITTHLFNEGKPAVISENNSSLNRETIWNLDRLDKMTIQNKMSA